MDVSTFFIDLKLRCTYEVGHRQSLEEGSQLGKRQHLVAINRRSMDSRPPPRPGKPGAPAPGKPGKPAPPTPAAGPCNPIPAPLPAGRDIPGPACIAAGTPPPGALVPSLAAGSLGGGPSTEHAITFAPLTIAKPSMRFSSLSTVCCAVAAPGAPLPFVLRFTLRYSSQSARTRFMCLSKASIWPTSWRPSFMVARMR